MSDIKKIIQKNLKNLFEGDEFKEMESAFGVDKELSDKEKAQFDDMEEVGTKKKGMKQEKVPGTTTVDKTRKDSGKEATSYYKDTAKKMKKFQTSDENQQSQSRIGEALEEPKIDREQSDAEAYETEVYGGGMQGLKYDDEGSEKHDKFEEREEESMKGDPTYDKLKKNGKKYKDHKYNKPDEYHNSPKVRVQKENRNIEEGDYHNYRAQGSEHSPSKVGKHDPKDREQAVDRILRVFQDDAFKDKSYMFKNLSKEQLMNMDDDRFVTVFQKVGNMARSKFSDRRDGEKGWHPSYGKNALR
jgi:hypothetical protein